jgi:CheY-like chemotaxis protein
MMSQTQKENRVFLIEDDQDIRSSIIEVLEDEGISIEWATNGEEAMQKLLAAQSKPSLILLDLRLPVKDGFQFRSEQLGNPQLAHIPVVVISADGKLQEKTETLGISGLLKKPVDIDQLVSTVRENLH